GGVDYIYRLDKDLQLLSNITTGPINGTENYNKILAINYDDNNLVTCGSDKGYCQIRDLTDLSVLGTSDVYVAAPTVEDSTVGFVAPGYDDKPMLYVGTSKRGYAIYGSDVVSGRELTLESLFDLVESGTSKTAVDIKQDYQEQDYIIYVSGFSYGRFSYFLTVQRIHVDTSDNSYITRIVRVCQERNDYYYNSYTEVTLQCNGHDGTSYNLLQAAHVMRPASDLATSLLLEDSEQVLFAVFAKGETSQDLTPLQQSVVCMYKMSVIEQAFTNAISDCVNLGGDEYELKYISGSVCPGTVGPVIEPVLFQSESSANEYSHKDLATSTILSDMVFDNNTEHLNVLTEHTVYKVKVQDCNQYTTCSECFDSMDPYCGWCTLERRCSLYSECPLSDQTSRWLDVFSDDTCVNITSIEPTDSIPFTVQNQTSRWLDVFSDDTCVNITSIEPTDSIPITVQNQIVLKVAELPDERNISPAYECIYENWFNTPAIQSGQSLSCDTPPTNQRPDIPSDQDHVAVQLSVRSVETSENFVNTDFYYFECSYFKMCTECVSSNWACDWCIYENRCTHESDTCVKDDNSTIVFGVNNIYYSDSKRIGHTFCPQLQQQSDEVLIPVEWTESIMVFALNLEDITDYTCILRGDEFEDSTPATRHNETLLECSAKQYKYDAKVQELNVSLSVQWNGGSYIVDDIYGFTVTLYNCSFDRLDCSECLSTVTTREELQCGWCVSDTSCQIEEQCTGNRVWLPQVTTVKCDDPVITQIWPSSGPYLGGTDVIISGSNLGKYYSLVQNVTIAEHTCVVIEEKFRVARSLECTTESADVDYSGTITVTVTGNDGSIQTGTSDDSVQFTWRKPTIVDFHPKIGPKSGGTTVIISGQYMDAGRNITVDIGGSICTVDRMNENHVNESIIVCMTSPHDVTPTAELTVYFDGATSEAMSQYEYADDPSVNNIIPLSSIYRCPICEVKSTSVMRCLSPQVNLSRQKRQNRNFIRATVGLIMDDVTELLELEQFDYLVYIDPEYFQFIEEDNVKDYLGGDLFIKGENLALASTKEDVTVYIGKQLCTVTSLSDIQLSCSPPPEAPSAVNKTGAPTGNTFPEVRVEVGNLYFFIGYLKYEKKENSHLPLIGGVAGGVLGLLTVVILTLVLLSLMRSKRGIKKLLQIENDMNKLEMTVSHECKRAFLELQTDMSDLNSDLRGTEGIPFLSYNDYAVNMMFAGQTDHPVFDEVVSIPFLSYNDYAVNMMFAGQTDHPVFDEVVSIPFLSYNDYTVNMMFAGQTDHPVFDEVVSIPFLSYNDYAVNMMFAGQTDHPVFDEVVSIPFLSYNDYAVNMMFAGQTDHPVFDEVVSIPFLSYNDYAVNMMFAGQTDHPVFDEVDLNSSASEGLRQFHSLLTNKQFLLIFIQTLEEQKDLSTRENVLKTLLARAAEKASEENKVKIMLRRTETVMEKLLTNWFVLSLHRFIKKCTGSPIFFLYKALKHQIEKGPVDAVTGFAKYSLNDDYLLREHIRDKIFEWRGGRAGQGHLTLKDDDITCKVEGQWKRINTMGHYQIPDEASLALVYKEQISNVTSKIRSPVTVANEYDYIHFHDPDASPDVLFHCSSRALILEDDNGDEEEGKGSMKTWHLIKSKNYYTSGISSESKKSKKHLQKKKDKPGRSRGDKVISEIYLGQLLQTKGTVSSFVDDVFKSLLTYDKQQYHFPSSIKYMFDYLDNLAEKYDCQHSDVPHIWKSNSLPLRIWANIIKCPHFVFDINLSYTLEGSLDIIAQTFIDACSKIQRKLGKEAPVNKLLFAKELPEYRSMVDDYYEDIKRQPSISEKEMVINLEEDFTELSGKFNKMSALNELYKYATKYGDKLLDALEDDDISNKQRLAFKLEAVAGTMAGSHYDI
ncbi:LOW QUALITY PROTEIN: plexin-A2-like, partial [Saccoglossus kowalevskii]